MTTQRTILIVEDEPLIAMMLEDFLDMLGHQVRGPADAVASGTAALAEGPVDLAIVDVNLRGGEAVWPLADTLAAAGLPARAVADADPRGAKLAQAVFDAMFADMDTNLREMGVGDMSIGRRVKRMWEDWHGRARAYEAALESGNEADLTEALSRNVWGGAPPEGAAEALARHAQAVGRVLSGQGIEALAAGRVDFGSAGMFA